MSGDIRYRLFFNDEPASREELDQVEDITVEQEINMAWEARLEVPTCLDNQGRWRNADRHIGNTAQRVRIEISVGDSGFVPLIDGPVIKRMSQMRFQPGQSNVTLVVRDDSDFLDREVRNFYFEDSDQKIIKSLFETDTISASDVEIDDAVSTEGNEAAPFRYRGTAIDALHCLARRYGLHVNVLPGDNPGESRGCFRDLPNTNEDITDGPDLPEMVLFGERANISELNSGRTTMRPARYQASTLRMADKEIVTEDASFRDRELLGERDALAEGEEEATELVDPSPCVLVDADRAVSSKAEASSYVFESTGSIIEGCYQGVLLPYRLVRVRLGGTPKSGTYIIRQVTHTLTRSAYSQSFSLISNAESEVSTESTADAARSVF